MKNYTQLAQEQRYQIYALKKMGHDKKQADITRYEPISPARVSHHQKQPQNADI